MNFEYGPADQEALERRDAQARAVLYAERQAQHPEIDLADVEDRLRQASPGQAVQVTQAEMDAIAAGRLPVLAKHEHTHGDFKDTARTAQSLKYVLHNGKNWSELTMVQQEALDSLAIKIARILSGDPNHPDSWADIEGYARLVREQL